jgi:hypothetical protein
MALIPELRYLSTDCCVTHCICCKLFTILAIALIVDRQENVMLAQNTSQWFITALSFLVRREENNFSVKVTFKAGYESRIIFRVYIISWFILARAHRLEDRIPVPTEKSYHFGISLLLTSRPTPAVCRMTLSEGTSTVEGQKQQFSSFEIHELLSARTELLNPRRAIQFWGRPHAT